MSDKKLSIFGAGRIFKPLSKQEKKRDIELQKQLNTKPTEGEPRTFNSAELNRLKLQDLSKPKTIEPRPEPLTPKSLETKAPKPIAFKIGPGEEEKLLEAKLDDTLEAYKQLTDPSMTPADLRTQMVNDLKQVRGDKEQTLMWAQLAERFLAAATKYGAAKEGLSRGLNMSQAEIERTDWDKMTDRAFDQYKEDYADLVSKFEKEDKAKAEVDKSKTEQVKAMSDLKLNIARLKDARAREMRELQQRRADRVQKAQQKLDLTPAQKKVDESFAKDYNEFIAQGGQADAKKQINQLEEVIGKLGETDTATGRIIGLAPKMLRDIITPEGSALQDSAEEVIQRNLRLILGAQFTEKEGERLIARAYNPRLSEEENARRLTNLVSQMKEAFKNKAEAVEYYEQNGTLKGFKGKLYRSADTFIPEVQCRIVKGPDGQYKQYKDGRLEKINE